MEIQLTPLEYALLKAFQGLDNDEKERVLIAAREIVEKRRNE